MQTQSRVLEQYLGLGLGASSLVEEQRFHNTADMRKYMEIFGVRNCSQPVHTGAGQPGPAAEEMETLSAEDQMEEFVFLGLRKTKGISCREFQENFGKSIEDVYGDQIGRFKGLGLMKKEGDRLWLTERGIDVSNSIFVEFVL